MTDPLPARLTDLRVPAPNTLLPEVLATTGLADRYAIRESPIGPVYVAFNDRGISAVEVADDPEQFEESFPERFGRPAVPAAEVPARLSARIDRAIAEGRPGDLAVDLNSVTDFQARVLRKAAEIPLGEVRPYGWVAREIGSPSAARAVGSALARNPVPLVVPCHRVVRSDGRFGEYSLGTADNKPRLLEAEGLDVAGYAALIGRGVRFLGSDTTRIFCHPTCRDARRITDTHLVEFRSAAQAGRAGYRPCRRCRPAAAA
jgi:O-6-methylguanine DNA methyltransferase